MLAILLALGPLVDLGFAGGVVADADAQHAEAALGGSAAAGVDFGRWHAVARLDLSRGPRWVTHVSGEVAWTPKHFILGGGAGMQFREAGFFVPWDSGYHDDNFAVRMLAGWHNDRWSVVLTPVLAIERDQLLCPEVVGASCGGSGTKVLPTLLLRTSYRFL